MMYGCTPHSEENVVMRSAEELDEYYSLLEDDTIEKDRD